MPSDKAWTMNCILTGANAMRLLLLEKPQDAQGWLSRLTTELEQIDIDYLMNRLKQLEQTEYPKS